MKNILGLILLLGISTASAQPIAYGHGGYWYNATPYGWGGYAENATPYAYGYAPGFGMMGGYGYPYGGMMGGMMGPGMMGGYGYPYGGMMGGYGPYGYGYGFNPLLWIAIIILVAIGAYLLGKRSAAGR